MHVLGEGAADKDVGGIYKLCFLRIPQKLSYHDVPHMHTVRQSLLTASESTSEQQSKAASQASHHRQHDVPVGTTRMEPSGDHAGRRKNDLTVSSRNSRGRVAFSGFSFSPSFPVPAAADGLAGLDGVVGALPLAVTAGAAASLVVVGAVAVGSLCLQPPGEACHLSQAVAHLVHSQQTPCVRYPYLFRCCCRRRRGSVRSRLGSRLCCRRGRRDRSLLGARLFPAAGRRGGSAVLVRLHVRQCAMNAELLGPTRRRCSPSKHTYTRTHIASKRFEHQQPR